MTNLYFTAKDDIKIIIIDNVSIEFPSHEELKNEFHSHKELQNAFEDLYEKLEKLDIKYIFLKYIFFSSEIYILRK